MSKRLFATIAATYGLISAAACIEGGADDVETMTRAIDEKGEAYVRAATIDEKGEAYVVVDGVQLSPASDDSAQPGPGSALDIVRLPPNYGRQVAAERAARIAELADPGPFLARLADHAHGDVSVALVERGVGATLVSPEGWESSIPLVVVETISGPELPRDLSASTGALAGETTGCGLFDPKAGERYAVLLEPGEEGVYSVVQRDDYHNGWFFQRANGDFEINRGPVVTRTQLAGLAARRDD